MYAKIWHINAFDMHSITSLSHEKILLAKPECLFCRSNSVSKNSWPYCEQSKLRGAGRAIEATYTALVG